ncbi:MAG: hypothetical protein LBS88_07860 [Tannerellaceae bacterium]|jgi:hypothetical protein|nr:hypothetical protein [Tannerellaceae bacterium]
MKKRKFIFASMCLFVMLAANSQEIFHKGTNVGNLGIGLGSYIPVEVSFEHGIIDGLIGGNNGSIGIGGYAAWYSHSDSYDYGKWVYNNILIGVRGSFHYQFVKKLDTYAGLMLGYDIASSKWDGPSGYDAAASASGIGFSLYAGARYYFQPTFGVYGELGYGIAYLSVGVTKKF